MILPLAYFGSGWLRKKAEPVLSFDNELKDFVSDMIETMNVHNGIGLAATQVKQSKRIFITCVPQEDDEENPIFPEPKVYVNPRILSFSEEFLFWNEACLSIPGLEGCVPRPKSIEIEAYNREGELFKETLTDFYACNFLHENDHLNGILYIDRISQEEKERLRKSLHNLKKRFQKSH